MDINIPTSQSTKSLTKCPVMNVERMIYGHHKQQALPGIPFKNPQCLLKPTSHLPSTVLAGEFQALSSRTGSTSTPYVSRTSAASVTQFTPCFSDSSLNDSAIDTSCGSLSSATHVSSAGFLRDDVFFSATCVDSRTRKDDGVESPNTPKAVLFSQMSNCDECDVEVPQSSEQTTDDDRTKYINHSPMEHSTLTSTAKASHNSINSVADFNSQSELSQTHSSELECSPPFHCSNAAEITADTGYESHLASESSTSSMSMCLSQFAPKELDRLIGPKMGLNHVDIISHLSSRNLIVPLNMIMRHLSRQDLRNMCKVSSEWSNTVHSDLHAYRKLSHKSPRKMSVEKENCVRRKKSENRELTRPTSTGSAFSVLQATASNHPTTSTPTSAEAQHMMNLSEKYWKEAEWLKNEEYLRKCPKCSSPAKVNPAQERAWCCNRNCIYDFCIKCHSPFHGAKDCGLRIEAKKQNTKSTVGTKRSKKNLRRL